MLFRFSVSVVVIALSFAVSGAVCARDAFVEGEVLVVFKSGLAAGSAKASLAGHGLKWQRQYGNISRQRGRIIGLVKDAGLSTDDLIARLKANPNVESADPNYLRRYASATPDDTEFPKLWGLKNTGQTVNGSAGTSGVDTGFTTAWSLSRTTSPEVVVGVVDSGVDITHPDLAANIWTNPGEIAANGIDDDANGFTDDVHGYDFGLGTAVMTDQNDHGTHVAGTIAAAGRNHAGVIGVQFRAKILPLKIENASGVLLDSAILDAFDYAVVLKQQGANIVALNASFVGTSFSNSQKIAIEALRDNGIILCAAAGNLGTNNDSFKYYPASHTTNNIIAVAAHTQTNTLASFSNYGATTVDIAAPGENILSTLPQDLPGTQGGVTVGAAGYAALGLQYAGTTPLSGLSGSVHACGIGNPGDFPPEVSGNIALIERGILTFAQKLTNAMNAGAAAAIMYDNLADPLGGGWTLGAPGPWIPALQVTQATGSAILTALPTDGTIVNFRDPSLIYQFLNGTSMATPHVAGAVAFAAWNFPAETLTQRLARVTANVTPVPAFASKMTSGGRLNLLKMVDTDTDGLPDWWEEEHFGNLAEIATGDDDLDGFPNLTEFLAATDPEDPASRLLFTAAAALEDGEQTHFMLAFPSVEHRDYRIEWSAALESGSWQPLGPPVTGTGGILQVQDPDAIHSATRRFYRMSVLPD